MRVPTSSSHRKTRSSTSTARSTWSSRTWCGSTPRASSGSTRPTRARPTMDRRSRSSGATRRTIARAGRSSSCPAGSMDRSRPTARCSAPSSSRASSPPGARRARDPHHRPRELLRLRRAGDAPPLIERPGREHHLHPHRRPDRCFFCARTVSPLPGRRASSAAPCIHPSHRSLTAAGAAPPRPAAARRRPTRPGPGWAPRSGCCRVRWCR